jgi:hypothetical protein
MKPNIKIIALFMGLFFFPCSPDNTGEGTKATKTSAPPLSYKVIDASIVWDFNDLTGWEVASRVGLQNYWIEGDNLTVFTNPNTWERTKIKTLSTFTTGTYTWRLFAPQMGVGDMASMGAFSYLDDTH